MERFRCAPLESFVSQLVRGPRRLRLRQLHGIEFVLSVIEADKSYPLDFVVHALTGYRAASTVGNSAISDERALPGDDLMIDLVALAEMLSQDADLAVESANESLYTAAEVAERLKVSTKTIFRWRRRGLVSWKFRCEDRRIRVFFPERSVQRFVSRNGDLVQRGSNFSQLTATERTRVVTRAEELVTEGERTVNSVAKVIAGETGRAVETIRLILKAHDDANPRAGVFNRPKLQVPANDQRLVVWEAYVDGATVEQLAERFDRSIGWVYRIITQMRARDLKHRRIEFVPSPDFDGRLSEAEIMNSPALHARGNQISEKRVPAGLPPYLQQLFRQPLLTAQREVALFRKFNYLKYRASRLCAEIDPEAVSASELDRIDALLSEASGIKNEITQANLRLVVSIAKRHAGPHHDFFEIVSDGNVSLMRAIDKFDYSRGFKFSTYGSWAIMKNYARSLPEQRLHRDRYQTGRDELLEAAPGFTLNELEDDSLAAVRATLDRMLGCLDSRERTILRQRFGLDGPGEPQTLDQIGRKLGVSKERVRQLESRAMARLRTDFEVDVQQLLGT